MSVIRPRNKLVYFRLSEEEFQRVTSLCEAAGARSISDLARIAVRRFLAGEGGSSELLHSRLRELDVVLSQLNRRLQDLNSTMQPQGAAELAVEQG